MTPFLDFILENFECFWLTTHCKGNTQTALSYLKSYYPPYIIQKLESVKATQWDTLKTEGIDFTSFFFWLEDYPMQSEILVLEKASKSDSLIRVNLQRENELNNIMEFLRTKI